MRYKGSGFEGSAERLDCAHLQAGDELRENQAGGGAAPDRADRLQDILLLFAQDNRERDRSSPALT